MASQITCWIFAPGQIDIAWCIAEMIYSVQPTVPCRIYSQAQTSETLRFLSHRPGVTILVAVQRRQLNQFVRMAAWLEDQPLILIVPDNDPTTIAKAHRLRPRYLGVAKIDFSELRIVLQCLLNKVRFTSRQQIGNQKTTNQIELT